MIKYHSVQYNTDTVDNPTSVIIDKGGGELYYVARNNPTELIKNDEYVFRHLFIDVGAEFDVSAHTEKISENLALAILRSRGFDTTVLVE